jgi:drug/metabolite transporter (DMT)-like permease
MQRSERRAALSRHKPRRGSPRRRATTQRAENAPDLATPQRGIDTGESTAVGVRLAKPDARVRADLALLLVTIFWGLTFPLIRDALTEISAEWFVLLRFAAASILFLPLLLALRVPARRLRQAVGAGAVLGCIAWSSYFAQTLGLRSTGAGRAAFLTGVNVVLVPLLSPLFRAGRPNRIDAAAAALALLGMYLLTDPARGGFRVGDVWILLCALAYAVYIHVLQKFLQRGVDPTALAFTQIVSVALCAALVLPAMQPAWPSPGRAALLGLGFCALFATVATFWLQARFQARTTPERVALIFALEPVFAAAFAYFLLAERLRGVSIAGAALILFAVAGAEWWTARRSRLRAGDFA